MPNELESKTDLIFNHMVTYRIENKLYFELTTGLPNGEPHQMKYKNYL